MNKDHAIGFGIGLLTGAVVGGVIALAVCTENRYRDQAINQRQGGFSCRRSEGKNY